MNTGVVSVTGAQTNVTYSGSLPRAAYAVGIGGSLSGGLDNIGTITAVSAGQALVITPELGSQLADLTLGVIDASTTPYGLANTGAIVASTARSGETVTGVLVAGVNDGVNDYAVTIAGGIQNSGSVTSTTTADGTAIGIDLGNLASTPTIVNSGTISGVASSSSGSSVAFGLLLDAGANLSSLDNSGTISGSAASVDAYAYGIVDRSGTLLAITNTGTISATATTTDSGTTSAVAIDLSQAQGGITLTSGGKIVGEVLLGEHDDTVALVADSDGDSATTSTWTGALSFGGGTDTFAISGGGVFTGGIGKTSGMLAITVDDGVLALGASNTVSATTIDFGAASKLILVLDPTLAPAPRLDATQSVTFANGATIEATVTEFVGTDFTAIVARAPTITASLAPGDIVFDNLPFLYAAQTQIVGGAEQELDITLHLKSASDLGLNANQTAFYNSVLDILGVDDNTLETPLLAQSDAKSFAKTYEMLMPNTSQPTLRAALITTDDIERNLQGREGLFLTDPSFNGVNAWWAGSGRALSLDSSNLSRGIDGDIVSTTFGADYMFVPWAMVGAEVTFGGADLFDAGSQDNVVHADTAQGGVYASLAAGPLYISGSAGAGSTSNRSVRVFDTDDFSSRIEAAWDGTFLNAAGEVGINAEYHHAIIRPWVGVSWLKLDEEAHQETTAGTGLDLSYDSIDAEVERARAGVTLAYDWVSPEVQFTPELRAAWSQLLNTPPDTLSGSFVDGSVPFLLSETPIAHDQISAGFGFTLHGKGLAVSLGYDATLADGETSHSGKLAVSTQF